MFEGQLPRQINVLQLAQQGVEFSGQLLLKDMIRLLPSLMDNDGEVIFELTFGVDEEGIRYLKGAVKTELTLLCQRCLQPMAYAIDNELMLGTILSDTQAQNLPSHYDPLLITTDMQELLPIIEDELIVCLPIVANHNNTECKAEVVNRKIKTDNKRNPFAQLSKLKQ